MNLKVLLIPDFGTFGGTFTFLRRLLEIHETHGIATAVLVEEQQLFPAAVDLFERYGVVVFQGRLSKSQFTPCADLYFGWRAYREFRPDLVVASNGTPGTMAGALLCPVPVIFFIHTYPRHRMRPSARLYFAAVSRLKNRFVTVSEYSARAISELMGIPRARIDVVHNSFAPVGESGDSDSVVAVLTVGHVASYKNPELWVRVAEEVVAKRPDARFIWLGDGELLAAMQKLVRSAGLERSIAFHGYCDDVRGFYRQTAVYFQPSLMESHGISVVEAMAHGIACVTSDAGGLPESVVDGETGFTCSPHDAGSFVARIIELLDNDSLRERMATAGKTRAQRLFSEEIQECRIVDLYKAMTR